MQEILVESVLQIVTRAVLILLSLAGTWAACQNAEVPVPVRCRDRSYRNGAADGFRPAADAG